MKALRLIGPSRFEFADTPDPVLANPDDVIVGIKACGICGSDVHGMDGSSGRRIPPVIMGHEASGVVHSAGDAAATTWKTGDRVTFDSTVYCGECEPCRRGEVHLCDQRRVLGVSCEDYRQNGAFAELLAVPSRILYRLPDGMSFRHAAFAEPVSVALHAVQRMPVRPGDSAVVVGAGLIGLLVIQALRHAGCSTVIAVDLDARRLELATQLGAAHGLQPDTDDVAASVRKLTADRGSDLAMEVVGISPTLDLAVHCLRKGGSLGCVGNIAPRTEFPLQTVVTRELSLFGTCGCGNEYANALQGIADGSIEVEPLISQVAPLADGAGWFQRLADGSEGLFKVILEP